MFFSKHYNRLFASFLVFISTLFVVKFYFDQRYLDKSQQRYEQVAEESDTLINTILDAHKEKVALAALYLSQQSEIKRSLIEKDPSLLDFASHFAKGENFGVLEHAKIQVIDSQGYSFYRSWTDLTGDPIIEKRKDLQLFFRDPKVIHTISVGIFDLTIKTIVPIYHGQELLGAFEIIGSMNGIIESLDDAAISGVILVNEGYKAQLRNQDPSRYIDGSYIVNETVNPQLIQAIKKRDIKTQSKFSDYFICDNSNWFVSFKHLQDVENDPMATLYLFQRLGPIKESSKQPVAVALTYLSLLYIFILVLYFVWYFYQKSQRTRAFNKSLVSEVQTKDKALAEQADFWQKVIDGLDDLVLVVDRSHQTALLNEAAKNFNKDYQDQYECAKCHEVLFNEKSPCSGSKKSCPLDQCFQTGRAVTVVQEVLVEDEKRFIEFTATPLFDARGEVEQVIEVGHDITTYMLAKQQLEEQKQQLDLIAYHDSLTGLPNRLLFLDRLQQAIDHSRRAESIVALLFIDLDLFKQINDTHGHKVGDLVLVESGKRLEKAVRKTDTVSRLGGDEFTVILEQISHAEIVVDIVHDILHAISEPYSLNGKRFYLSASIGVSLYPTDGLNIHDLLKNADTAMYQAKDYGRNNYSFYNPEMTRRAIERIELEDKIREAIEKQQFEVYYQPQFDVRSLEVTGFEALIRWKHPVDGMIMPVEFIPLAEETGMIIQIGKIVMQTAMEVIADWHHQGLTDKRMAINISAKQFSSQDMLADVKKMLEDTKCDPHWIELEITESSVMKNKQYAANVLAELKKLGITVSIDDFGTGYSSLAQLKRMPIDKLKIDQSFVSQFPNSLEDIEITKTIIAMATNLGMQTIAEGIESPEQSEFIRDYGCNFAQGFLFSHPIPKDKIETLLKEKLA